jgi:AbrB family looped-hinge helix DNA binding protein
MKSSSLSSKGQVTIPLEIRKRLGVKEGDRIEFVIEGGKTIVRPARGVANPFAKYVGAVPHFRSRTEVKKWVRDLREDGE